MHRRFLPIPVLGLAIAVTAHSTFADEIANEARILSPADGGLVAARQEIVGQVPVGMIPVLAVRSTERNSLWWIQEEPTLNASGVFKIESRFGNTKTASGSSFHFVIMLATKEQAKTFEVGQALKSLPEGFPVTPIRQVTLDHSLIPGSQESLQVDLLSPKSNGEVVRVQDVELRIANTSETPIMLVRSLEKNSLWWVQDELKATESKTLAGKARFGNERTPPGANFLVVFILPDAATRAALKPGSSHKELPEAPRSKAFPVSTQRNDVAKEKTVLISETN